MHYFIKARHVKTGESYVLWESLDRTRSRWCADVPTYYPSLLETRQAARRGLLLLNGGFTVTIYGRPIIIREGKS